MSFLAPPENVLGKTVVNPLLTVTASRAMPHCQAAEMGRRGVEPKMHTLVQDGSSGGLSHIAAPADRAAALAGLLPASGRQCRLKGLPCGPRCRRCR